MPESLPVADRYVNLLIETINGSIYGPESQLVPRFTGAGPAGWVRRISGRTGLVMARRSTVPASAYDQGDGWPAERLTRGDSMLGRKRLSSLAALVRRCVEDNVPGDVIETGVWRGGACILMRGVLASLNVNDRSVYVADSFDGLPLTAETDDAAYLHYDRTLAVGIDDVRANFERYGLLDDQVVFVKGWFAESLPALSDHQWALIRLDGDLYESTRDAIINLYDGLSVGGYVVVDDFYTYESCRRAIEEFRSARGITDELHRVDGNCVYWQRSQE